MADPTESKLFLHGSHVNDVVATMYLFWQCPACGAQREGMVEATIDDNGVTTFNDDECPSCEEKDMLVELSLVRKEFRDV